MSAEQKHWSEVCRAIEEDSPEAFADLVAGLSSDRIVLAAANVASLGASKVLSWWLSNGLDPNQMCYGAPILKRAAGEGHVDVVRLLLDAGARRFGVSLVAAASSGSLECVRLLVEAGADVDHGNPGFPTPLGAAEDKGHVEIARYLREKGATRRVGA